MVTIDCRISTIIFLFIVGNLSISVTIEQRESLIEPVEVILFAIVNNHRIMRLMPRHGCNIADTTVSSTLCLFLNR